MGAKQLKKAISGGRAKYVYLADNADPAITDSLESMCIQFQIDVCYVPTKQELGRVCGIDVGAAAAAVVE